MTKLAKQSESSTGSAVGFVAVGVTMAVCCGAGILASIGGLGIIASFLISPWALLPASAAVAGIVYWQRQRRRAHGPRTARKTAPSSAKR